jgi:hypothetical protein
LTLEELRDEVMDCVVKAHPDWNVGPVDGEPAFGIENEHGEYFVEVNDA